MKAVLLNRGQGADARIGGRLAGWHALHWLAEQGLCDVVVCGTPIDGARPGWRIVTLPGGRLKDAEPLIDDDLFIVVTLNGFTDIELEDLVACSRSHGRIATIAAARATGGGGAGRGGDDYESAGVFVLRREVFGYLDHDSELEHEPLVALARDGELFAFRHEGFFQPLRGTADASAG